MNHFGCGDSRLGDTTWLPANVGCVEILSHAEMQQGECAGEVFEGKRMKRRIFLQYFAVAGGVVAVPLMTVLMIVNISGKFAVSSLEHRLGAAIVLGGLAGAMVAIACSRVSCDHVEVRLVNIATVARISWPLLVGVDSSQGLVLTSETGKSYKSAMFPTTVQGAWMNKKLGLLRVVKVADAIVAAKADAASGPQTPTPVSRRAPRWTVAIYVAVGIVYGLAVVGGVRGY